MGRNPLDVTDVGEWVRIEVLPSLPTSDNLKENEGGLGIVSGVAVSGVTSGVTISPIVGTHDGNRFRIAKMATFQTVSPTVNDDDTKGWVPGDQWTNITTDEAFWCLSNKTGGAIWQKFITGPDQLDASAGLEWNASTTQTPTETEIGGAKFFNMLKTPDKAIVGGSRFPSLANLAVNPTLQFEFAPKGAAPPGAGNIVLNLEARYVAVGESFAKAADETQQFVVAVNDVVDERHAFTFTLDGSLISNQDVATFKLRRLGSHASDTYSGTATFLKRSLLRYKQL